MHEIIFTVQNFLAAELYNLCLWDFAFKVIKILSTRDK